MSDDVGLYIHVPFCERICPYCDFAVVAARPLSSQLESRYLEAVLCELDLRAPVYAGRRLASIYLGGGTPSLLQPDSVARLLEAAERHFGSGADPEITLEVNPSTTERERLPGFRSTGVNRLSIGIQSFDDTVLRRLGRAHKADEGHRTLSAARAAGYENVSLDLIFAAPGQDLRALERDLAQTLDFGPEHVSAYELTIEPRTPFGIAAERGQLERCPEDEAAEMIELVAEGLQAGGCLERYEISSYARPGYESVHNRRYWERRPVLGLGLGAWSTEPSREGAPFGSRRANVRALSDYLRKLEAGESGEAEAEVLDARTARGEAVFLGLRCSRGLAAAPFAAEFGAPPGAFFPTAIRELCASGLLEQSQEGDLWLTPRGRLLCDLVSERFV